ncbi:MAG: PEP-CTERM sorting domain-containing protein [Candidatus Omnitrophica bacterium]|nr:PEP-CTERM sorting domain-containing protein [Candidatus Omnitrophota bacterium]
MKNRFFRIGMLVMLFGFIVSCSQQAYAIVVDGDLSDWGVTAFTDWTPDLPGTSYSVEDNTYRPWTDFDWEPLDIEAMYINDCKTYINFAVVSSNPYSGLVTLHPTPGSTGTFYDYAEESLFLDFSGRTVDQLLMAGDYKYAADVAILPLDQLSIKGVYKVNQDHIYKLPNENGAPYTFPVSVAIEVAPGGNVEYGPFYNALGYQEYLGSFEVYNKYLGNIEAAAPSFWPNTYVLEGRIDKSIFVDENFECGSQVEAYFSRVQCLSDWITVRDSMESPCLTQVPEPVTMSLFGLGLAGFAWIRKRKMAA